MGGRSLASGQSRLHLPRASKVRFLKRRSTHFRKKVTTLTRLGDDPSPLCSGCQFVFDNVKRSCLFRRVVGPLFECAEVVSSKVSGSETLIYLVEAGFVLTPMSNTFQSFSRNLEFKGVLIRRVQKNSYKRIYKLIFSPK